MYSWQLQTTTRHLYSTERDKLLQHHATSLQGEGRGVTIDSAYMGDIMAQIGRFVWKINMVGTAHANHTAANDRPACKKMKEGTHEPIIWHYKTMPKSCIWCLEHGLTVIL